MPCMIGRLGLSGRHLVSTLASALQLLVDCAQIGQHIRELRVVSCLERMALVRQCIDSRMG